MQLELEFDKVSLTRMAVDRGITGIALDLIVFVALHEKLIKVDGCTRLAWKAGERAAAGALGCSKSGLNEALGRLQRAGLVTRARGLIVVEWSAFVDLPLVDPLAGLPPLKPAIPAAENRSVGEWSVGGRSVVGSLEFLEESKDSSNHPSKPNPRSARYQETDQRPTGQTLIGQAETVKPRRLTFQLRWKHLFTDDRRPNREGIIRLHQECQRIGWIPAAADPLPDFARTLGLVLWIDSKERAASGVQHPLSWLIAALRDGRERMMSWPGEDCFERARTLVDHADGLREQLTGAESVCYLERNS